ncbi:MAG: helix-turn-helix transcriptional regulator, partial [Pseudomonadota bacterium]
MKRLRLERGLTQAALAERLDTTQQTIGRWESGITPPKIDTIVAIATALGVEVTELIDQEKLSQADNQAKTGTNRTPENYWGHFAVR